MDVVTPALESLSTPDVVVSDTDSWRQIVVSSFYTCIFYTSISNSYLCIQPLENDTRTPDNLYEVATDDEGDDQAARIRVPVTPTTTRSTAHMSSQRLPVKRRLTYEDVVQTIRNPPGESFVYDADFRRSLLNRSILATLKTLTTGELSLHPVLKIGESNNLIGARVSKDLSETVFVLGPISGGVLDADRAISLSAEGMNQLRLHASDILEYLGKAEMYRQHGNGFADKDGYAVVDKPYSPARVVLEELPSGHIHYMCAGSFPDNSPWVGIYRGSAAPKANMTPADRAKYVQERGGGGDKSVKRPGVCMKGVNFMLFMKVTLPIMTKFICGVPPVKAAVVEACSVKQSDLDSYIESQQSAWVNVEAHDAMYMS